MQPRSISFNGTVQTLEALHPVIAIQGQPDLAFRISIYQLLLDAVATHRVADRPNRFEPRLRKQAETLRLSQETKTGDQT